MKRSMGRVALALAVCLSLTCCGQGTGESSREREAPKVSVQQMEEKLGVPVVSVMTDLPNDDMGYKAGQLQDTLKHMPGYGKDFAIYEEQIPREGAERENAITRVKTEMMAGKGPDLFLCEQDTYGLCGMRYYGGGAAPFFTFPEKAMKNRLFLPLDEYIEKAEFMEWDKFLPVVMEAGRNEEGQQIIPMSFCFEALYADRDRYGLEEGDRSMTLGEMRESENPAIRYASSRGAQSLVGRVMEPGADEPMFTEEELLGYMRDYGGALPGSVKDYRELEEDETLYSGAMIRGLLPDPDIISPARDLFVLGDGSPGYRIIPARNVDGGVTASINEFAAINRNARHPDLAFKIIDYVMSTGNQQKSELFGARVMLGMPVHTDVGSRDLPIDGRWYMSEENFKEYRAALDEITGARFIGPADKALWDINAFDERGLEKNVHEQYTLIRMLLAES